MARNQAIVNCPAGQWTELTNADAEDITFQVLAGSVEVRATEDATPPTTTDRGYFYRNDALEYHEGELRVNLNVFADSITAKRMFARPVNGRPARLIVDHDDAP